MYQIWLKRGVHKPGKSAAKLAKALEVQRSAVYKMMAGTRDIRADELQRISKYIEEPVPALNVDVGDTVKLPIEREIGVGVWFERDVKVDHGFITTPRDFEFPNAIHHAYLVKGDSMVKSGILDGDVIICVETGDEPRNGRIVVIERDRSGIVEISARVAVILSDRVEYRASSENETYKPVVVPNKGKSAESVTILSVVRRVTRDLK